MSSSLVYKILPVQDWARTQEATHIAPSPVDARDGYVHLSSAEQTPVTLQRHFANESVVVLLEFDASALGDALRWETNVAGEVYPHLYGVLETALVRRRWRVIRDAAGAFVLPDDFL